MHTNMRMAWRGVAVTFCEVPGCAVLVYGCTVNTSTFCQLKFHIVMQLVCRVDSLNVTEIKSGRKFRLEETRAIHLFDKRSNQPGSMEPGAFQSFCVENRVECAGPITKQ